MKTFDALRSAPARVAFAIAGSLVASCRTTVELDEFDRTLRTTEAQTIVVAKDHTLYAPFGMIPACEYAGVVAEEVAAVRALFGVELAEPLPIWLRPVRGLTVSIEIHAGKITVRPPGVHPHHGIEAYATESAAVVYVEAESIGTRADGQSITGTVSPTTYRATVRHELAHVWTHRAGIAGASWFNEGLAEHVESMKLADGRLVPDDASELLGHAASLPRERCTIRRLLDWRENGMRIHEGLETADASARAAAGAFVHFLMAHVEGDSFLARAHALRSLSETQLLAHEERWQAWRTSPVPRPQ